MINILEKKNCCGCSACANICPTKAIKMIYDEEGFLYPNVDNEKCINCGQCQLICPILNKKRTENKPIAYAAYNKNELIRKNSTSGGAFTSLAQKIIEMGGIVFGASFDKDFIVKHTYTNNVNELEKYRGSKYVQSEIGDSYIKVKEFLEQNKIVLFSGTPCQIYGLKSFLKKEYDNLYCVDVVCHGVPSPLLFDRYKKDKEKKYNSKINYISFREKTYGYESSTMTLKFKNNKVYSKGHGLDYMLKLFMKGLCSRPSCYDCKFKTISKVSDFTVGDLWNADILLKGKQWKSGTTLILIHTKKGQELINSISNKLFLEKIDLEEAIKYNANGKKSMILYSDNKPLERKEIFKDLDKMGLDELVNKYTKVTTKDKLTESLKPVLYHTKILSIIKNIKKRRI